MIIMIVVMYEVNERWEYNGILVMEPSFYHWVFDKLNSSDEDDIPKMNFGCNADVMQHSGKDY